MAAIDLRKKKKPRDKTKKGRFGLLYKQECRDVLTDPDLSHFEARLAMILFSMTNWENQVVMPHEGIAQVIGKPRPQVSKAMKRLQDKGIIRQVQNGVVEVNPLYFFMGEDDERNEAVERMGSFFQPA